MISCASDWCWLLKCIVNPKIIDKSEWISLQFQFFPLFHCWNFYVYMKDTQHIGILIGITSEVRLNGLTFWKCSWIWSEMTPTKIHMLKYRDLNGVIVTIYFSMNRRVGTVILDIESCCASIQPTITKAKAASFLLCYKISFTRFYFHFKHRNIMQLDF